MAKSWRNGVMTLDSASQGFNGRPTVDYSTNADGSWVTNPATSVASLNQRITSITVDPSASSWVVVLSDQDGNVIWSEKGAAATGDTYIVDIESHGVVATTLTNITRVILRADPIQW
jgi:hypothetical protein